MVEKQKRWKKKLCRTIFLVSIGIFALLSCLIIYLYLPRNLPPKPSKFTTIAHRGVSQTFPLKNLENDTCTATIIYPPTHSFLENTIPSIAAAFQYGADVVELDIHSTTDDRIVVFHDWTIDCRTEGKGITREQSWKTLKKLDIGYGYTADGGKTYPFRGKGRGLMPKLEEVLTEFPDRQLLIDQKDTSQKTIDIFANILAKYPPQQRQNLYLFSGEELYQSLKQKIPEIRKLFQTRQEVKECIPEYLKMLFGSNLTSSCSKYALGIPVSYFAYIPRVFFPQARKANLQVYAIEVDTPEDLAKIEKFPLDGIVTNRIETIGLLLKNSQLKSF